MSLTLMVAHRNEQGADCLSIYDVCCIDSLKDKLRNFQKFQDTYDYRFLELKLKDGDQEYFLRSGWGQRKAAEIAEAVAGPPAIEYELKSEEGVREEDGG